MRNALLTSIAPTGTISLFADNVSSGIEPVFAFSYTRNVLMPDGSRREEEVSDYAYRLFRRLKGETRAAARLFRRRPAPEPARPCRDAGGGAEIHRQLDLQDDQRARGHRLRGVQDRLPEAYDLGCKGCTTYRPNEVTGAVLELREDAAEDGARSDEPELPLPMADATTTSPRDPLEAGGIVYMTQPLSRPEGLPGQTYKMRWPESDHAIYITINDIVQDGRRRPFEVFINSKNMEHYAWTVALTRMISAVFRRGGDVSFVVDELKAVFDPRGGQWMGKTLRALAARRDRRGDREAHDRHRLHPQPQGGARGPARAQGGRRVGDGGGRRRHGPRGRADARLPQVRRAHADPPGGLRHLHELRALEVRVRAVRPLPVIA